MTFVAHGNLFKFGYICQYLLGCRTVIETAELADERPDGQIRALVELGDKPRLKIGERRSRPIADIVLKASAGKPHVGSKLQILRPTSDGEERRQISSVRHRVVPGPGLGGYVTPALQVGIVLRVVSMQVVLGEVTVDRREDRNHVVRKFTERFVRRLLGLRPAIGEKMNI